MFYFCAPIFLVSFKTHKPFVLEPFLYCYLLSGFYRDDCYFWLWVGMNHTDPPQEAIWECNSQTEPAIFTWILYKHLVQKN